MSSIKETLEKGIIDISSYGILFSNLFILVMYLIGRVDVSGLLFVYCFETLILSVFTAIKIFIASYYGYDQDPQYSGMAAKIFASALISVILLGFHIFYSTIIYIFLNTLNTLPNLHSDPNALILSVPSQIIQHAFILIVLVLCHGFSFFYNFIHKEEYRNTMGITFILGPMLRSFPLYLTFLLFPLYLVLHHFYNFPYFGYGLIFIISKGLLDQFFHTYEHSYSPDMNKSAEGISNTSGQR